MATPGASSSAPLRQHIVVIGADTTCVRLVEELTRAGELLVVLAPGERGREVAEDLTALGARVITTSRLKVADFHRAQVSLAKAVVILGDDDVFAVRVALAIEEILPSMRFVIEMSNPNIGGKLQQLLGDCILLSSAELAAPAFVAAATATPDTESFEIGGRPVVAGPRDRVGGELLAVLANSGRAGVDAVLPPGDGDIVLGTELLRGADSRVRRSGLVGALTRVFDRRARLVVIGLLLLILLSTLYFHLGGRDWLASLYLALTASTTTGDGDLSGLSVPFRFGAVIIQLFGLVITAGITALIVDLLISSRFAALSGGVRGRPRHHVVVCGLGRIGTSVTARLRARGVPVVAIERREDALGVLSARQLKVPVIIAPASDPSAQQAAGIARADAVLAVTDDQAVNLEIALQAKNANPGIRVVARVFDHDLADRVEHRLELGATRSLSMLAAPAFAAAALGRRREVIFPIGRRVLLFTELMINQSSAAPGKTIAELEQPGASKILAWSRGTSSNWEWGDRDHELRGNDRLAVVATRTGLARLLRATKPATQPVRNPALS